MTKKEILAVLLPSFADWEIAFTAAALNDQIQNIGSKYCIKTVGCTKDPIKSIGGLSVLPDYDIQNLPKDYVGILLVGGMSWCTQERKQTQISKKIVPLVQNAIDSKKIVGAICDATTFLGANGWLNNKKHTSNTRQDLITVSGKNYTNQNGYIEQQAVRDGTLITANGTAYLEFTKEILFALEAYEKNDIEAYYDFYKNGYFDAIKKHKIAKGI